MEPVLILPMLSTDVNVVLMHIQKNELVSVHLDQYPDALTNMQTPKLISDTYTNVY